MLRTPYNYDRNAVSQDTALVCSEDTLTQQNFKEDADLNIMLRKYGVAPVSEPNWEEVDFSNIGSYHDAMNAIVAAQEQFDALPAEERVKHDNDPGKFMDYWNQRIVEAEKAKIAEAKAAKKAEANSSVDPTPVVDADKEPTE
ncbi:hypothetical protein RINTHH_1650 [Richelia intracellularis HH01]|uniref:Internal scaffolding protein n=1 Tax=Richelia intracellularis HH01 TaxID=1165094 RepID=M1X272_9NOST|nr:hypothetical protein [Richelia intracellularis]CCH66320.1 hypothetical protein RINTHH_1650 [Richelia intracellularis HH01]